MRTLGEQLRDKNLTEALRNDTGWADRLYAYVYRHLAGMECTGEEIRTAAVGTVGTPRHPNCWGAAIMLMVRDGLLEDTGYVRSMARPSSHARRTPIWKVRDK